MAKKKAKQVDLTDGEKLIQAIEAGKLDELKQLIADGADVNEIPQEDSPLGAAVRMGTEDAIDLLLAAGADASSGGLSVPLATAAFDGNLPIVKKLLAAGAEVNAQEEPGTTALMGAARNGSIEMVKVLLDGGADAKITDGEGRTALSFATEGEYAEIVALLKPLTEVDEPKAKKATKSAGKSDIDQPVEYGRTKLHLAAHAGDLVTAKKLVAGGADLERKDDFGATPLMATIGNRPEQRAMFKFLVESGADLHARDEYGRNVLSLAERYFKPGIMGEEKDQIAFRKLLVEVGLINESAGALCEAAAAGDLDKVKSLLAQGVSADATDDEDRTPLYMAVSRQQPEVVALLLKSKASPSKPIGSDSGVDTQYGGRLMPCPKCKKPFMSMTRMRTCPACKHHFDVADVYRDAPGDQDLIFSFSNDWTPLMAAARLNETKLAAMLLDAGAKVDAGREDATPLMCACAWGHVEMAKMLIARGAKVNAICKETGSRATDQLTAVQIAGEAGNAELLEMLWDAGAKTENQDVARLVMAAGRGDLKAIKSHIKAKVDVSAADPFQRETPVYAAAKGGHAEAITVLLEAGASVEPPKRGFGPLFAVCSEISEGLQRGRKTQADVPRYLETVKLLLARGAKANVSMYGQSPLAMAKEAKLTPLIEMLEEAIAAQQSAAKKPAKAKGKK